MQSGNDSRVVSGARIFVLLVWMWLRSALAYRTSLVMMTIATFLLTSLDMVAIVIMFGHIDELAGFGLPEVALLYGMSGVGLAVADLVCGNGQRLGTRIRLGRFDEILLRPAPALAQACADQFQPRRLGRVVQASAVLGYGLVASDIPWTVGRVLLVPGTVVCATLIFAAILVMGGALQFLTQDATDIANSFSYGSNNATQYPLSIFPDGVIKAMTLTVPLAFINWYPCLYLLHRPDPIGMPSWLQFAAPVAAAGMCLLAGIAWRAGIRRYQSAGS